MLSLSTLTPWGPDLERGEEVADDEREARQDIIDGDHIVALEVDDWLARSSDANNLSTWFNDEHDASTGR